MNWARSTLLHMKSKVRIKYFVHDCSICIGFWRWSYKIISAATSTLRIVNGLKINFTFFLKLLLSQSKYLKFFKQTDISAGNYMFKVNNRNWRRSGIFIVNFEHISHFVLVFLLLTLSR